MRSFNRYNLISMLLLFLALSTFLACGSTSETTEQSPTHTTDKEELYWARIDSAQMQFTKADVRFMRKMIGHHAQALIMSELVPSRSSSNQVKILARRIINSQNDEIASMKQWLSERKQPVPELRFDGIKLYINGMLSGHMDMAGMLSQKQLEELKNAEGNRFDHLFLKYMIGHHTGALIMVDKLLETGSAAQEETAFKLVSNINADQQTEIERMERLLDSLPPVN